MFGTFSEKKKITLRIYIRNIVKPDFGSGVKYHEMCNIPKNKPKHVFTRML